MPVTPAQVQTLVVLEVGECPDNRLSQNAATVWALNAGYGAIYPPLQRWYTKLNLIDLALGYYREQVNTSIDGTSMAYQQRVVSLLAMRADTVTMLGMLYAQARASRGIAVAPITQTTPELPPPLQPLPQSWPYPDANSPRWSGSPYYGQGSVRDVTAETP